MNNFNYPSDFGSSFLGGEVNNLMNPTSSGALGGGFNNVMNSVQTGISRNASQGIVPGNGIDPNNLNANQIAAQMNTGGVASILPLLGNSFMPKLMFPIAGLFSLVQVSRSVVGMARDFGKPRVGFDPKDLQYNKAIEVAQQDSLNYDYLGPQF